MSEGGFQLNLIVNTLSRCQQFGVVDLSVNSLISDPGTGTMLHQQFTGIVEIFNVILFGNNLFQEFLNTEEGKKVGN